MMLPYLPPIANHLWQSTLFATAAALLALALRNNRAQVRYCLWLAASAKFLIPFALLQTVGAQFDWHTAGPAAPPLAAALEQFTQPFIPASPQASPSAAASPLPWLPALLALLWLAGFAFVAIRWWTRWQHVRRALRTATPVRLDGPVPVRSSPTRLEPGIFGIFRPVLLLPEGIADRLSPAQFHAVLAHEFCHVRRRDNQTALLHMLVEAAFWFHPLVWWIGSRLIAERERACDEEVLRLGNPPEVYAAGILGVCRHYLESPLSCAPGVTGADLRKRIEEIMTQPIARRLTFARKTLLAAAGGLAIAGPVLLGLLHAPQSRAQAGPGTYTFDVVSVKPVEPGVRGVRIMYPPGGGFEGQNIHVKQLIRMAYDVQEFQISGGPRWLDDEGFDILAKAPASPHAYSGTGPLTAEQSEQIHQRLRALLADRFHLVVTRGSKEAPVYALVVAKGGHKLQHSTLDQNLSATRSSITATGVTMSMFTGFLGGRLGRPVQDSTGLAGGYDFKLEWTPDSPEPSGKGTEPGEKAEGAGDPGGPTIFTAIQQQLGLKIESQKGQVEVIVIERVERPAAN